MADDPSTLAFVCTGGGDDAGIATLRIDEATGAASVVSRTPTPGDPSFLTLDPDGTCLYVVTRDGDGHVVAYRIDRDEGTLSHVNSQPSGADTPVYCSVDATGSVVLIADYWAGSVSSLPIRTDGSVDEPTAVIEHEGSSVHPERQTEPHPHSIVPGPENRFAYVPDLGTDRVVVYRLDLEERALRSSDVGAISVHDGAGPRHLVFRPDGSSAFLVNELDSTVTAFERDGRDGGLSEIATASTLPADVDGENKAADVHVHPSGRWVYCSNRGHDSIAIFEIEDDGEPVPVGHESTRGRTPRHFALDPAGRFLFAENKDEGGIVVFEIDEETGTLSPTGDVVDLRKPVCMAFSG